METEAQVVASDYSLSRRAFLERAGLLGVAAALAQIPFIVGAKGLTAEARAATLDLVRETLNAVLAFILPGDDEYSVAQGESAPGPGAVGSNTVEPLIKALDHFVPAYAAGVELTVPAAGGVAALLNSFALQVNPAADHGNFLSPFARLSFKEKAEVFRRFELDRVVNGAVPELAFVAGIMHGYIAFLIFSEGGVQDPRTRQLTARPVGWTISGFAGPGDGYPELKGYFQGRKTVTPPKRKRKPVRRKRARRKARTKT
jgi:hypothetical protein